MLLGEAGRVKRSRAGRHLRKVPGLRRQERVQGQGRRVARRLQTGEKERERKTRANGPALRALNGAVPYKGVLGMS